MFRGQLSDDITAEPWLQWVFFWSNLGTHGSEEASNKQIPKGVPPKKGTRLYLQYAAPHLGLRVYGPRVLGLRV